MPFPYFERLPPGKQRIYLKSDGIAEIRLAQPERLRPSVAALATALQREDRGAAEAAAQRLADGITEMLRVPGLLVQVLPVRPRSSWGELHGLYTEGERGPARIKLWMRTAANKRVVAFKTFLRTLLHELLHHLDYRYLKLGDSFHTEGFFRRESSLVRQLFGEARPRS